MALTPQPRCPNSEADALEARIGAEEEAWSAARPGAERRAIRARIRRLDARLDRVLSWEGANGRYAAIGDVP